MAVPPDDSTSRGGRDVIVAVRRRDPPGSASYGYGPGWHSGEAVEPVHGTAPRNSELGQRAGALPLRGRDARPHRSGR